MPLILKQYPNQSISVIVDVEVLVYYFVYKPEDSSNEHSGQKGFNFNYIRYLRVYKKTANALWYTHSSVTTKDQTNMDISLIR